MTRKRPKTSKRVEDARQVWVEPICVECGGRGELSNGARLGYKRPEMRARLFYVCPCGARVGCHPGTAVPMGLPCGAAASRARQVCHAAFDPIWQAKVAAGASRENARQAAYKWLAREIGIRPDECHIGYFNKAMADRAIAKCASRRGLHAPPTVTRPGGGLSPTPRGGPPHQATKEPQ